MNQQVQTRTTVSASAAGMALPTFTFPVMTFIMAISTTTATTINTTSVGASREALGVSLPSSDLLTRSSPTTAKSGNNVLNLATVPPNQPGTYGSMTTNHWSAAGNTARLQMYTYNSSANQNFRNVTDSNYLLRNRDVLFNKEIGRLNTTEYLLIPHLFRAFLQGGKTPESYSFSYRCGQDLAMFYLAWSRNETWAWNMFDSSGKRRPGLLSGTMTWSGNLEQCLSTHVTYSKRNPDEEEVRTRFCSVYMTPPTWLTERMRSFNIPFPVPSPSFITDVCALSGCTDHDLHGLFQQYVIDNSWRENLTVTSVRCYKEKKLWDDIPAVVSLCLIFLLLMLVIAGTVYEIILRASRSGVKSSLDIKIGLHSIKNPALTGRDDPNTPTPASASKDSPSDAQSINADINRNQAVIPETKDVCYSLESGRPCSNVEAWPKSSSADVLIGIPEEQNGSSSRSKEADSKTSVKCNDLDISAHNSINTASAVGNMSNKSHALQETDTNKSPSTPTSTGSKQKRPGRVFTSSIKSALFRGSMFKNRSWPRVRKRHLPTRLSTVDTNKTSVHVVTLLQRMLVTFSIRRNMTNVFGQGHADMLFCLNGLRVLGNSWIVLGSYFTTIYSNPAVVENHLAISKFGQSIWGQFLINTSLSADTFFVISGALNMYNLMKAKAKPGRQNMLEVMSPADYIWAVIHRLFRILPCYYLALMIHANLGGYLGTGRELRQPTDSSGHCRDHWWANILFISNFYKADQMCMPWSYYLVNDLQLSILSPLVTIPVLCRPVLGFGLLIGLVGLQIVSVMVINTNLNGNSMRMATTDYFSEVYVKPYCRAGVYAIGVGLGYFLYSGDKKIRLTQAPLCVGWLLCLTSVFLLPQITYLQYQEGGRLWSGFETSLYEALSRPIWGLAVSWIIFTCCNSQGGLISKLLSWNVFIPMARITYAVYVLHPILMEAVLVSTESNTKITFEHMTLWYISLLAGSWCLAICMILLVEQPFVQMEAIIRNHIRSKRTP